MENSLPESWEDVQLIELLEKLESGSRPKGGVRGILDGIPSVGGEHVNDNGGFDFSNIKYIPKAFAEGMNKGKIEVNDILIVKDGATTGKTSFVDSNFPYKTAFVNEHVFICRPSEELDSKYVYWFLRSKDGNGRVMENFKGSAQGGINQTFASNTLVPVAPLLEQQRIVAKLDELMEKIDRSRARLDRIPKILKRFRQSILSAAVGGKLTEEWRERNNYVNASDLLNKLHQIRLSKYNDAIELAKSNNSRRPQLPKGLNESNVYVINEDFEIPNSWRWSVLDKISTVALGGTPSRKIEEYWNGEINWVSSGEVANNQINSTTETITNIGLENSNAKIYPKGTILLAMIGEGKTRGQVSMLNVEAATNQNVAGLILDNDFILSKYLWYFLLSRYESLRNDGLGGAQPALNAERVGQMNVVVPPYEEQNEIVRKVEQLFSLADKIEARYTKAKAQLDKLPQSLLAKAFRGELVPQDSTDEPASVLLERIKNEKATPAGKTKKLKRYEIEEEKLSLAAED